MLLLPIMIRMRGNGLKLSFFLLYVDYVLAVSSVVLHKEVFLPGILVAL